MPIYWLNGPKVADNYVDFYDGTWDDKDGATLEDGSSLTSARKNQFICTGTNDDGTTASQPVGAGSCAGTKINVTGNTLSGESALSSVDSRYLVLSGVFRVGNLTTATIPVVESVVVTSDPGSDGEYVKDDAIKVTVTFSEAVAVTGTPKIKMRLAEGAPPVKPRYAAAESTATALVFSYTHTVPVRVSAAGSRALTKSMCKVTTERMRNKGGFLPPEPTWFGPPERGQAKAR